MAERTSAKTSAQAEALGVEKTYDFDGKTYKINPDLDVVSLLEHYDEGHMTKAAKELVGPTVYDQLRRAGKLSKMDQLNKLVESAMKALGTELGE